MFSRISNHLNISKRVKKGDSVPTCFFFFELSAGYALSVGTILVLGTYICVECVHTRP